MKKHRNYSVVESENEFKECLGDFFSISYANELIQKAKVHNKHGKRIKTLNKKRLDPRKKYDVQLSLY